MKKILVLIALLTVAVTSYSQSNNDKALAYYKEAMRLFKAGSYSKTIEYLNLTEDMLSSTNPRILNLKVKTYFAAENYVKAQQCLEEFLKFSENTDAKMKEETLSYIVKIENAINAEAARIERERIAEARRKEKERLEEIRRKETEEAAQLAERLKRNNFKKRYKEKYGDSDRYVFEKKDGKIGLVDKNYNVIIPFKYSSSSPPKDLGGNIYGVALSYPLYKYGLVDIKKGKEILECKYYMHNGRFEFNDGLLPISFDSKWGYVNKKGEIVIPLKFEHAESFSEGMASVGKDIIIREADNFSLILWGFIDKTGKLVIPYRYQGGDGYGAPIFREGLAAVKDELDDSGWRKSIGYIDQKGNIAIPFRYYKAGSFRNGEAKVKVYGKKGIRVINKQEKVLRKYKHLTSVGY